MGYHDILLPETESYDSSYGAGFRTKYVEVDSSKINRFGRYSAALFQYNIAFQLRKLENLRTIHEFFLMRGGGGNTFKFQDPLDFTTRSDGVSAWDGAAEYQTLSGTVDGNNRAFQCVKTYSDSAGSYIRVVTKPRQGSSDFYVNQVSQSAAVDYTTGAVIFDTAPGIGTTPSWRGEFDIEVFFGPGTDDALKRAYEGYNKGAVEGEILLIEEPPFDIPIRDDIPYGGSKEWGVVDSNISLALGEAGTQEWEDNTGIDAILPPIESIPSGAKHFVLVNAGSQTTEVMLNDATTVLVNLTTTTRQAIICVLRRSSGVKEWIALT